MQWLFFPLALVAGTLMVVQAGCNGALEKALDRPVMVGAVSLGIGVTALLAVGLMFGQFSPSGAGKAPWWAWLGGICGAAALLSQPIAAPRLGAAIYIGLFVSASSIASVVVDHFGVLGFPEHGAGPGRIIGCALMVIGIGLISVF